MRGRETFLQLGLVLLAGCSVQASCGGGRLDMDKARSFISNFVENYASVKPTNVTCPEDVKAAKGANLVCTFEVGGVTGTITMKQTDAEGSVSVSSVTGIVASAKMEEVVLAEFKKQGVSPKIDCGPRVHPAKAGHVITCDASDGQNVAGRVSVTVKDEEGNVSFTFVPAGQQAAPPAGEGAPPAAPAGGVPSTPSVAPGEEQAR